MLRRVARVLRLLLTTIGVVLLLLLLFSVFIPVWYIKTWDSPLYLNVALSGGNLEFIVLSGSFSTSDSDGWGWLRTFVFFAPWEDPLPTLELLGDDGSFIASLPLWLLAFLCLAWPVTSFLLARRRRGRGFPVEIATLE